MEWLRGKFAGTTFLPKTEREAQFCTLAGVLILFVGLAAPARDAIWLGLLTIAFGVIAWVAAARRPKTQDPTRSAEK